MCNMIFPVEDRVCSDFQTYENNKPIFLPESST